MRIAFVSGLLLCVKLVLASTIDCTTGGWTVGAGYYFKYISTSQTWSAARTTCQAVGSNVDLAVLSDKTNYDVAMSMATAAGNSFWIGMNQSTGSLEPEIGWSWIDGNSFNFLGGDVSWANDWPWNNYIGNRVQSLACGKLLMSTGIVDADCTATNFALCAIPSEPSPRFIENSNH
jgi:hypothetical protein